MHSNEPALEELKKMKTDMLAMPKELSNEIFEKRLSALCKQIARREEETVEEEG